jgi:hypothetical protein
VYGAMDGIPEGILKWWTGFVHKADITGLSGFLTVLAAEWC